MYEWRLYFGRQIYVGGLVGAFCTEEYFINNNVTECLNTGVVRGNLNVGGIVGLVDDEFGQVEVYFEDCYNDKQMCPRGGVDGSYPPSGGGVHGKITRELTGHSLSNNNVFSSINWNFYGEYIYNPDANFYPTLKNAGVINYKSLIIQVI